MVERKNVLHINLLYPIGSAAPVSNSNLAPRTVVKSTPNIQPQNVVRVDSERNFDFDYYVIEQPTSIGIDYNVTLVDSLSNNLQCSASGVTDAS